MEDDKTNVSMTEFISSKEAAALFDVTNDHISRLCRQGRIKGVLEGGVWLVDKQSLIASFAEKGVSPRDVPVKEIRATVLYHRPEAVVPSMLPVQVPAQLPIPAQSRVPMLRGMSALIIASLFLFAAFSGAATGIADTLFTQRAFSAVAADAGSSFVTSVVDHVRAFFSGADRVVPVQQQAPRASVAADTSPLDVGRLVLWPHIRTGNSAIVQNVTHPVIERVVETQRVVTGGGVTLSLLEERLKQLDERFTAQLSGFSFREDHSMIQNIRSLAEREIDASLIFGDASLSSLSVSGDTSVGGDASVSGDLTVSGSATFGSFSAGTVVSTSTTVTNLLATNATTTNLVVGSLTGPLQAIAGVVSATSTLSISYGGTGTSTAPTYGKLLVGNAVGGYDLLATSSLGILSGGGTWGSITGTLSDQTDLQSALDAKLSLANWYATTTDALDEGVSNLYFTSARATSNFITNLAATSSVSSITALPNLSLTSSQIADFSDTVNSFVAGSTTIPKTYTANTWTGLQTFANASSTLATLGTAWLPNVTHALLSTNGSGQVVATTSIGTNYLTGTLGTINGTTFNAGGSITITAASSTLLADNNTFSGSNIFSSPLTLSSTSGTTTIASGQGFTIGGSQFVVQQGSGNVGIGTASPSKLLDVGGAKLTSDASGNFYQAGTASLGDGVLSVHPSNPVSGVSIWGNFSLNWNLSGGALSLWKDDTGILSQRTTGSNPQAYRLYNTYTDASNYERGVIDWQTNSNVLSIGTQAGGTGTLRNIALIGGSVGIGTTTPYSKLTTWGTGNLFEAVTNSSSTVFLIGQTGATTTNFAITSLAGKLLSTNANGSVVATTSIGTNYLTGTLGTINGTTFNAGGSMTITAASSTLLANNNTWTGANIFSGNVILTNATTTAFAISNITSALPLAAADGSLGEYAGTSCTNQFVRSLNGAGVATCATVSLTADVTGILPVANGGTGWANIQSGALVYGNGSSALATTTAGTNGQVLALANGIPTWTATTTFSSGLAYSAGNVTNTGVLSLAQTYGTAQTGALTLATSSDTNLLLNVTNSGGTFTLTPAWTGTLAAARLNGNVVQAITNDTNITGSISAQNLTLGWTGQLAVSRGGTGQSSFTAGNLLYGSGTNGVQNVATTSATIGSSLSYSGTFGALVGGASGTLSLNLANSNWWTARQNFTNASTSQLTATSSVWFTALASKLLSTDANGLVTGTTSIGTNYLTGTLGTINGTTFNAGGSMTITAASSTLLANNNTWTGANIFSGNVILTNATTTAFAISNITSALPLAAADGSLGEYAGTSCTNQFVRSLNGAGVATCATVSLTADVTGILPIANGGTNASSIGSHMLTAFDGTRIVSTSTPTAAAYLATSSTANSIFAGKLGVGSLTAPTYTLDVNGFVNVDGTAGGYKQAGNTILYASSTNSSTLLGINAAPGLLSTALYNTALGREAMLSATSSNFNTAVGYQALKGGSSDSSGGSNTAVGFQALTSVTSGSSNAAFGYRTLWVNQTGVGNAAFGASALSNTTGSQNSAFGNTALQNNVSGTSNTAIGSVAQNRNLTGSLNVAIGASALYWNQSATNSVAVGYGALNGVGNYSSQGSVGVGYLAGYGSQTGSDYNTLIGYQAGYTMTTGQYNTILGYSGTSGGITSGSNNILIGKDVRAGLTVTSDNQLNIGNLIFGTGLSSGSTFSTGGVGIGTTTPGGLFEVGNTSASGIVANVTNGNSGTGAYTELGVRNGYTAANNADALRLLTFGSGWTTTGGYVQDGAALEAGVNLSGGLSMVARNTAGVLRFYTGGQADSNERMRITSAGNVGINDTTPSYSLDVNGFINADGTTGGYKLAGNTVLYASTTNTSLAVGASAAAGWMSASSSLWYSVAIGEGALDTTPTSGAAIANTAIGYNALSSNTTGSNNTANGVSALFSNTTGALNTANGGYALTTATSSSGNTAMGFQAGRLISGATGAVGSYNTLFGYNSGYGITTGARNVLLGQSIVAASYNQVTTGSNNIAIGNDVAVPSATANNQLVIGNLIYGTGLDGTGSTVSTGKIGIGTTTPYSKLTTWGTGSLFEAVTNSSSTVFSIGQNGATTTSFAISNLSHAILSTNANGSVVATTSIGTNYLTGSLGTVNGTTFNRGDAITITAASSTLLANNNTWSGTNVFSGNVTLTNATTTSFAITNITSALPLAAADGSLSEYQGSSCTNQFVRSLNGAGVATCATVSLTADVTGILPVANGGTATSTQVTNGVNYFDGTRITSGTALTFMGTNLGIGSSTPMASLSVAGTGNSGVNIGGFFGSGYGAISLNATADGTNYNFLSGNSTTDNTLYINRTSGGAVQFREAGNATPQMIIATGGNVGIGTTTPGTLLSVGNTGGINFTTATSTWSTTGGINIAAGCFAKGGSCLQFTDIVGTLGIAQGGTNATSQTTNGVAYYDGTKLTTGSLFTYDGTTTALTANSANASGNVVAFSLGGAQSVANANTYYGMNISPTFTAASGNTLGALIGTRANPQNTSSGTVTSLYGLYAIPQNTSSGIVTNMYGVLGQPQNTGTGITTTMVGVWSGANNSSTGTTTTMYGILSQPRAAAGGVTTQYGAYLDCGASGASATVTTCYELRLGTPATTGTVSTIYGLYQDYASAKNYFAGNVGLGTTTPGAPLDFGITTNAAKLLLYNTGANQYGFGVNSGELSIFAGNNGNINFRTGGSAGTSNMYITTGGNVGIGTTTPYSKLTTWGTGNLFQAVTNASSTVFSIGQGGATTTSFAISNLTSDLLATDANGNVIATTSIGTNYLTGTLATVNGTAITAGGTHTITAASSTLLANNNTFSGANIFSQPLSLTSTTGTTTIAAGQGFTIGSTQFVLQQGSGRVGITTASPSATLSLGTALATIKAAVYDAGNSIYGLGVASGQLTFGAGLTTVTGTPQMVLTSTGNVGIGTTTPGTTLTVQGSGIDNWGFYKQYGNNVLYASTTNTTLAVGASSAAAWMSASSTLWYSVAIGQGALQTAPTSGAAQHNTAVGYATLQSNTTGTQNTALGLNALVNNTSGSFNTSSGVNTLISNTTGSYNTAHGVNALISNTTGSYNAANGAFSLYLNKTGSFNAAHGYGALFYNTSATNTTALGYAAGQGTGNYYNQGSTYVGFQAGGSAATSSDFNTLVGYDVGYGITTGARNTFIGNSTIATSYNQVTTGSNNIAIGNDVAVPSATANNQLVIGNLIYGTGLDGTGSTVSTGNIGIGTTSPATTLSVTGSGYLTGGLGVGVLNTTAGTLQTSGNATFSGGSLTLNNGTSNRIFYGNTGIGAPGASSAGEKIQLWGTSGTVGSTDYALGIESGNMWLNSGGGFKWYVNSAVKMVMNSSGSFGIGTAAPLSVFSVTGPSAAASAAAVGTGGIAQFTTGTGLNTDNKLMFGFYDTDNYAWIQSVDPGTAYRALALNPNGGNVGIGTTSPSQLFSIAGNGYFTGQMLGELGDSVSAPSFSWLGDATTGIYRPAASQLGVTLGGTNLVTFANSGSAWTAPSTNSGSAFTALTLNGAQSVANTGSYISTFINPTYTAASGNTLAALAGVQSNPQNTSSGTITQTIGFIGVPQNTSSGVVTTMYGVIGQPQNTSTGTTTSMIGLSALPANTSSGTTTTMYGVLIQPRQSGTGSNPTQYGVYIDGGNSNASGQPISNLYQMFLANPAVTGPVTNTYGVYQQYTSAKNYFGGNVGIGTSTPTAQFHTTGTVRFSNFGAGTLTTDASGNVSVSSDERLKHVDGDFMRGLADIQNITPIQYHWNELSGLDRETQYTGFSAQNVREAIPEAVGENPNGFLSLNDRPILAAAVNALKEIGGIGGTFKNALVAWMASAENGIGDLFAKHVYAANVTADTLHAKEQLCVGSVCITEEQFMAMVAASGQSATTGSGSQPAAPSATPSTDTASAATSTDSGTSAPAAETTGAGTPTDTGDFGMTVPSETSTSDTGSQPTASEPTPAPEQTAEPTPEPAPTQTAEPAPEPAPEQTTESTSAAPAPSDSGTSSTSADAPAQ